MQEFEAILLKKLLFNGEFFGKSLPIIEKKFFSDIGNQELFSLAKGYYADYRAIPTLTELVAKVKNVPNTEIRSEIIKSLQTINKTEEVQNTEFMLHETVAWVRDAMYMEALQIGSDGLMKKDDALKLKAQKIMDDRAKVSVDSDLGLDFDDIDSMIQYYSQRNIGIKTQHRELNKRLGPGFLPGTLSVILAAAGIGKSLLMTDLISGMIKKGKNILLVSLEMADREIMKRVHANAMDLPINCLTDLSKTEEELNALDREYVSKEDILSAYNRIKTSGNCGKLFVKDYPAGSLSPLMLEQLVESYKIEKGIEFDAVFVDYLGIMKSDLVTLSAGLYNFVKSIGEEVRAVAKKLKLAIISASQLNRGATNNIDSADNSNVSDSLGTVMTADLLIFLLQNEEMKERKEIVVKITKNRLTGMTDTWLMNIDYIHMRFHDMLVQNNNNINIDISDVMGDKSTQLDDDFGIITVKKQIDAENFAKSEIREIIREDMEKVIAHDKKDPFDGGSIEDIFAELEL